MGHASAKSLIVYVDVDDTLVRSSGGKRIPIPATIRQIRSLKEQGAELYCWSAGGAEYARATAAELGLSECFVAFLPKPHVLIDDQEVAEWRTCVTIHPSACGTLLAEELRRSNHP